ncbi:unnamed protein product [Plutella xylostella]|uniref:Phenoloxidase-activating factor 2 n=1 Tax=Plutella xylostella TaxID=51655 RepID=A0A8S4EPB3_PLUXY|nr:unnamed protein product [Plutella xylostella]
MAIRTCLVILFGVIVVSCGSVPEKSGFSQSDGALYTDDAVILNAVVPRTRRDANYTRDGKQLLFFRRQASTQDDGAFGLDCETTLGKRGTCKSFRDCFPLVKVADVTGWDGWVMGHYDTCSYVSGDNMEVFGVCCTEGRETPPAQDADVQRLSPVRHAALPLTPLRIAGFPSNLLPGLSPWAAGGGVAVRQIPAQWPPTIPPLPTHPPDHSAPTHPPSLVAGGPTTARPIGAATTWPTKAPAAATTQATTKQSWATSYPTRPTTASPSVDTSCGIKNGAQTYDSQFQDEERIVGGHNAELNEWPWIVALFNNGRQFCGGSLIDDMHVLSAAHCVAHMTSWDVARLTARLGDHNIRSNAETQHLERKIKRVVRHRGFDMRTLYNDISILTLDQPVKFSKTIRPICLPAGSRAYSGLVATVIGWGSLRESGPQPSILQEVSIPVWSNQECRLKYGGAAPGGIVDHMLCAGKASMDSCSGDSGGPLMVNEGSRWTQVGVVSWGIGCGKGQYPGVYTRVTAFLPWIQKNSK